MTEWRQCITDETESGWTRTMDVSASLTSCSPSSRMGTHGASPHRRRQPYARMTAHSARGNDLRTEPPQLNNPIDHQHHVGAQGHLLQCSFQSRNDESVLCECDLGILNVEYLKGGSNNKPVCRQLFTIGKNEQALVDWNNIGITVQNTNVSPSHRAQHWFQKRGCIVFENL
jgi:hypothetical protein